MQDSIPTEGYHPKWGIPLMSHLEWKIPTKELGQGSYGKVFSCRSSSGKQVAIKRFQNERSQDGNLNHQNFELAFVESENLKMFENNPNIAKFYDLVKTLDGKYTYIVLELCNEGTLKKYILEKTFGRDFNEEDILKIIYDICNGLKDIHARGHCHFDLKPENIGILQNDRDVTFKLIDFGFVQQINHTIKFKELGTKGYMAPEFSLLPNSIKDGKSDIFSLGCILYEICYKSPFFEDVLGTKRTEGISHKKFCEKLKKTKICELLLNPGLGSINDLIFKCLTVNHVERISLEDIQNIIKRRLDSYFRPSLIAIFEKPETNYLKFFSELSSKLAPSLEKYNETLQTVLQSNSQYLSLICKRNYPPETAHFGFKEKADEYTYYGSLKGEETTRSGFGVCYYHSTKDLYFGWFEDDRKQGSGLIVFDPENGSPKMLNDSVSSARWLMSEFKGDFADSDGCRIEFMDGSSLMGGISKGNLMGKCFMTILDDDDDGKKIEYTAFVKDMEIEGAGSLKMYQNSRVTREYRGFFHNTSFVSGVLCLYDVAKTSILIRYIGEWSSLEDGIGTIEVLGKSSYKGAWKDLNANDPKAEFEIKDKFKFVGSFKNGSFDGDGVLVTIEKNMVYRGQFVKGKYHGKGELIRKDLDENIVEHYVGEFSNGEYSGIGALKKESHFYKGKFKKGEINDDEGKLEFKKDHKCKSFQGVFVKGEAVQGRLVYSNGDLYTGQLGHNFVREGKGKLESPGLETSRVWMYDGSWKEDIFDGYGEYNWLNKVYKGNFLQGKFKGEGKLLDLYLGTSFEGEFEENQMKTGISIDQNGNVYEGEFLNNMYDDQKGKIRFSNGDYYEGPFNQGKMEGQKGTYSYNNNSVYEGGMRNNIWSGPGKLVTPIFTYEGDFLFGRYEGCGELIIENANYDTEVHVMKGIFKNGILQGDKCRIKFRNGSVFDGKLEYLGVDIRNKLDDSFSLVKFKQSNYDATGTLTQTDREGRTILTTGRFLRGNLQGKVSMKNGSRISELEFDKGRKVGFGKIRFENNTILKLDFCDSSVVKGVMVDDTGTEISGTINPLDYSFEGPKCQINYAPGIRRTVELYMGSLLKNQPHGKGKAFFSNGDEIEAIFINGRQRGEGEMIKKNGNRYKGYFEKFHLIRGVIWDLKTLRLFDGEFPNRNEIFIKGKVYEDAICPKSKQPKPDYRETCTSYDGELTQELSTLPERDAIKFDPKSSFYYSGQLRDGKKEGKGVVHVNQGGSFHGVWKQGSYVKSESLYLYENPSSEFENYRGEFKDYKPNGKGVIKFKGNIKKYEGNVLDGVPHGKGRIIQGNDILEAGIYSNGKLLQKEK